VNVLVCLESPSPGRAVQAALKLSASLAGSAQIIVLSAGGPTESVSLTMARHSGWVGRVLHLDDVSFDKADFMTLGMVLAEAARYLEASLIIVGERSDDEGQGMVPAAIAHHLRAPIVARVQGVRLLFTKPYTVEVAVRAGGYFCTLESPLPLVLVTPAASTPALNSEPAMPEPTSLSIETLTLTHLGIDRSRLVPRPELLGTLLPAKAKPIKQISCEEAAAILLRHR
jgi:electron transfer flavoprotein alpha/beta subunit